MTEGESLHELGPPPATSSDEAHYVIDVCIELVPMLLQYSPLQESAHDHVCGYPWKRESRGTGTQQSGGSPQLQADA
eukprot:COSAG02_NODE_7741_length_2866_cov_1.542630_7_plen_77_part_00